MSLPVPRLKTDFADFDPGEIAVQNGNIYGLPCSKEDASLVLLPVPWEVTVSYRPGTAAGPEAIRTASLQVDLFDEELGDMWRYGIYMPAFPQDIHDTSSRLRAKAEKIIAGLSHGAHQAQFCDFFAEIDHHCEILHNRIESEATDCLQRGKLVGILGGDHSVSLGSLRAYSRQFENFGILHLDAHADLRFKYEGFTYSHASIMHHASCLPHISRIVQVGVRDFCRQELDSMHRSNGRIRLFTDTALKRSLLGGTSWATLCDEIIESLPDCVYVSFDIDGLDPSLCPQTGTPVPGGLSYQEAIFLLKRLSGSGRKIIGFDLVEIAGADDSWDSIVGARLLYALCCCCLASFRT